MKIAYVNPNATAAMTTAIVASAKAALPQANIIGLTNHAGPAAIEGPEDGAAAVPGMLDQIHKARAQGADAIVIACFDDTGLETARQQVPCPVLGIGQSAFAMASLMGLRFSVVTSLPVSIPVIRENIERLGHARLCAAVRASDLPVLTIEAAAAETIDHLSDEIKRTCTEDKAECVVLGCAGMAPLTEILTARTRARLIDGVAASAHLARAAVNYLTP